MPASPVYSICNALCRLAGSAGINIMCMHSVVLSIVVTFGDQGRLWTSHDDTNVERFTYS